MPRKYSDPVYELDVPWWIYDLAIAAGSCLLLWAAVGWTAWALLPLGVLWYGSFIEPRLLTVRRYEVGKGACSVTIAYVSDIHVGPYKGEAWVRKVVARTNALDADLILLGGDFLYKEGADAPKLSPLKDLRAPLGVYGILGNHDFWKAPEAAVAQFEATGVRLLRNESVRAREGLSVIGVDDDWYAETDLEAALAAVPRGAAVVALLHNPDLAPPAAEILAGRGGSASLMLSGHVHGGQIRLPLWGPVPRLPHHLGRKVDRGLFAFGGIPLILGAGVGESGPRARLLCPPEIVLVTLRF
jgi:hypothetical protein